MRTLYICLFAIAGLALSSCNDWLDLKGDTELKEKDMFTQKTNFNNALVGCYLNMSSQNAYGQKLSFGDIEELANLWETNPLNTTELNPQLAAHNYDQDVVKTAIAAIYNSQFNTIAQANGILKNIKENGDAIDDQALRAVFEGEAYAIRAYCQFDILRLFGQMPQNPQKQVELPYAEELSISVFPAYYSYADYVKKLEMDMEKALSLLKDNDPICKYSYDKLNNPSSALFDDDFLYFRQTRLNYWAVKALMARFYLYIGETQKAHDTAMEIINATYEDGTKVIPLATAKDIEKKFFALPSDCMFYLDKTNLRTYTNAYFPFRTKFDDKNQYAIAKGKFEMLFSGASITSNNRYREVWKKDIQNLSGSTYASPMKFYGEDKEQDEEQWQLHVIPMLRLSEMYLIAIETSNDLEEINKLYSAYMEDHNVLGASFESVEKMQENITWEYLRELYGEGQAFYLFKRTAYPFAMFSSVSMTEDDYIVPLPPTEKNPNAPAENTDTNTGTQGN